ncbi:anthranilate phosphoribosyltransferase [Methanococcus vannielii SB]|uniref:Anthranilate phosphoribosyltransferase n=1 Tax=Methanococcus vannielii (strain ATCC 35089 / DSM 1224 / JCM 13029 / OCM 148 / SB) TaxID=406327 RepID=TRPD_METVS|nr:anthranilate phosphoribosyltransferase [Methanococcus vannielii]A6UP19.1 RecName: Full=Anthranilate phosphoribosyltransferase [Methanococcus vannielii SB]ABR54241.1 anthranilate phosphoribosyltransferase [Methanococcus vannielii SB]
MLNKLVECENLTFEESYELFNMLLEESEIRIAAYLTALQTKGVTADEIAGFAKAMRDNAVKIDLGEVTDTCGTGGDGSKTINVSTAVSIILACFTKVAKHGNVSVTSKSGSANVYEALGCKILENPDEAKVSIEKTNFAFLFAPKYHPALKKIMPVRSELKIKTVFNILGPLANPANPKYQILGVNSPELSEKVANALSKVGGVKKALVINGNGLDELNPNGASKITEYNGKFETYEITPEDFGLENTKIIPCESPNESARRLIDVFSGKINEDRNFILMNAGAALYASEIVSDFLEGVEIAKNAIDSGKVLKKLEMIKNV